MPIGALPAEMPGAPEVPGKPAAVYGSRGRAGTPIQLSTSSYPVQRDTVLEAKTQSPLSQTSVDLALVAETVGLDGEIIRHEARGVATSSAGTTINLQLPDGDLISASLVIVTTPAAPGTIHVPGTINMRHPGGAGITQMLASGIASDLMPLSWPSSVIAGIPEGTGWVALTAPNANTTAVINLAARLMPVLIAFHAQNPTTNTLPHRAVISYQLPEGMTTEITQSDVITVGETRRLVFARDVDKRSVTGGLETIPLLGYPTAPVTSIEISANPVVENLAISNILIVGKLA